MRAIVACSIVIILTFALAGCGRKRSTKLKAARIGATESGIASWYGHPYHGRRAANGEVYDMEKLTAAHRTLPFDTWVRVKNLSNGKTVEVRVQDRGPFIDGRIIDLSRAAAREIDMIGPGLANVKLTVIARPHDAPPVRVAEVRRPRVEIERAPREVRSADPVSPPSAAPIPVPSRVPPPPAASPRSDSATDVPAELFGVQVGAFSDQQRAEEVAAKIRLRFGVARITIKEGAAPVYRVIAGEYPYIEDAESVLARLQSEGSAGFVVRLDP